VAASAQIHLHGSHLSARPGAPDVSNLLPIGTSRKVSLVNRANAGAEFLGCRTEVLWGTQMMTDLITTWAPLVLLLAVMLFALRSMRGMRARSPSGRTLVELYELSLEEMKRNTATLERIAQALERRNQ
jgi:hypothetical protein